MYVSGDTSYVVHTYSSFVPLWSLPCLSSTNNFWNCHQLVEIVMSLVFRHKSSICPSIHRSIHPSIHPPIHPSIDPSTDPSIHRSIHRSNHRSIHRSIHWSIHRSIHWSIHPHRNLISLIQWNLNNFISYPNSQVDTKSLSPFNVVGNILVCNVVVVVVVVVNILVCNVVVNILVCNVVVPINNFVFVVLIAQCFNSLAEDS